MIADEGFSKSFNKCWQNIQMNFSFSHTVNLKLMFLIIMIIDVLNKCLDSEIIRGNKYTEGGVILFML